MIAVVLTTSVLALLALADTRQSRSGVRPQRRDDVRVVPRSIRGTKQVLVVAAGIGLLALALLAQVLGRLLT